MTESSALCEACLLVYFPPRFPRVDLVRHLCLAGVVSDLRSPPFRSFTFEVLCWVELVTSSWLDGTSLERILQSSAGPRSSSGCAFNAVVISHSSLGVLLLCIEVGLGGLPFRSTT